MRDSIDLFYNKQYNIQYYNEQYIEQFDIQQYEPQLDIQKQYEPRYNEQLDIQQQYEPQYNERSSIFSYDKEHLNKIKYTELFELYNDNDNDNDEESLDNYEENNSILQLPLSYEQYSLMKKEWNKQLDTLSFSDIKTNNNNNSKKSIKKLFSKFLKKNNNNNKTKNVSFYRILIN